MLTTKEFLVVYIVAEFRGRSKLLNRVSRQAELMDNPSDKTLTVLVTGLLFVFRRHLAIFKLS